VHTSWITSSDRCWGQLVDRQGIALLDFPANAPDAIPLDLLLKAAGITYDDIRTTGGFLQVLVLYGDCSVLISSNDVASKQKCPYTILTSMNYYQYKVDYIPDSNSRISRTFYDISGNQRSLKNTTGIRIVFDVSGDQKQFSFPVLLSTLVSRYIILTLATFVVDILLLPLLPGRKLYTSAKYELSDNIADLRRNIVKEYSLKEKIKKVKKMAMFKQTRQIDKVLDSIKHTVTDPEYDQLLLACITVYVDEHNDELTSLTFLARLRGDDNKVKANLMLGRLKEAYLLAVKVGDPALVKEVREVCDLHAYARLVELCDQYLSTSGSKLE